MRRPGEKFRQSILWVFPCSILLLTFLAGLAILDNKSERPGSDPSQAVLSQQPAVAQYVADSMLDALLPSSIPGLATERWTLLKPVWLQELLPPPECSSSQKVASEHLAPIGATVSWFDLINRSDQDFDSDSVIAVAATKVPSYLAGRLTQQIRTGSVGCRYTTPSVTDDQGSRWAPFLVGEEVDVEPVRYPQVGDASARFSEYYDGRERGLFIAISRGWYVTVYTPNPADLELTLETILPSMNDELGTFFSKTSETETEVSECDDADRASLAILPVIQAEILRAACTGSLDEVGSLMGSVFETDYGSASTPASAVAALRSAHGQAESLKRIRVLAHGTLTSDTNGLFIRDGTNVMIFVRPFNSPADAKYWYGLLDCAANLSRGAQETCKSYR